MLAKSLPLKIILKHHDSVFNTEALLYGQAGMLDRDFSDSYPRDLYQTYCHFRNKYNLNPISGSTWKFLRLRPSNFPTIRISQFAKFLCLTPNGLFSMIQGGSLNGVMDNLVLPASDYWSTHYVFDKPGGEGQKIMGPSSVKLLIINGVAPFMFFYGLEKGQPAICEGVLNYLEMTGGETNVQIDCWKEAGFPVDNALQTQALLYLKQCYCDKKRCLDCRIGSKLLGNG